MSAQRRAVGLAARKRPRGPGDRKRRVLKVVKILLVLGVVGAVAAAGAFFVLYNATEIPDPNEDFEAQTTRVFYSGGKEEMGQFATQNRQSISLDEMPEDIKDAVVAAENRTFWTDAGIDPKGIVRAAFSNAQGNSTQGASTITQQYVKILYLTQERSLERKVKEAMLSLKLQQQRSKEQILEGYLNTIYFGRGAYGVQAAALAYFDKPAKELNLRECAVLASVLNSPTNLDPANGKQERLDLRERYDYTLSSMAEIETISAEEAERAMNRLPRLPRIAAESQYGGQRGHMLELVRDELMALGYSEEEIDGGGLQVTTTFTPAAMAAAEEGQQTERPAGFDGGQLHVAVASVEVGTGALLGFYGGHDYLDSQINWAVAGGMAGSTFKAFADAAAIKDGFSLTDTFDGNSPLVLPDGTEFENQGNASYGSVSMVQATRDSVNTAFIDLTNSMEDGPQKIIDTANDLGIPGNRAGRFGIPRQSIDLVPNIGVPLGTVQVSPINLANAYGTLANGGTRADVHVVEKVVDRFGETDYTFTAPTQDVLDPDIAADVTYALQQVVEGGSGSAAQGLGRPVAGKTGTATNDDEEVSSSWFVGTTPQVSTAVMYVRGKGREQLQGWLPEYFGGSYPARTWTDVMGRLMEGVPIEEFPEPVYVDGDAPEPGHEPTTPPPAPATTQRPPTPQPTQPASPKPSPTDEPTDEPTPTEEPTPTATATVPAPTTAPPPSPSPPPPSIPPPSPPPPAPTTAVPTAAVSPPPSTSVPSAPVASPSPVRRAGGRLDAAAPLQRAANW